MPIQSTKANAFEGVSHEFTLSASEAEGQPILLLWQNGQFVATAPRFKDRVAARILPAVMLGQTDIVRAALDEGLKPKIRDREGCTLLMFAAEAGMPDVVDLLLTRGAKPEAESDGGSTALAWAAQKGRLTVVQRLIAAGASVSGTREDQPLCRAIQHGHEAVARALIAAKAPVNWENSSHQTAFTLALDNGAAELAELMYPRAPHDPLREEQAGRALITQASLNHAGMVAFMVKHGVKADIEDRGFTALRAGAWRGSGEIARVLLGAGAKVDRADAQGRTALLNACMTGNVDYARALLEAGANPNVRDAQGSGGLHFAALCGNREMVELLLDRGGDARGTSADNYRPVELALLGGSGEVAALLAAHGATLDSKSPHIEESIVAALRFDLPELLQSAIAAGWSPATPLSGWSAMRLAEAFHAQKCRSILQAAGAIDFSHDLPPVISPSELDRLPRLTAAALPDDPRSLDQHYEKALVEIDAILGPDGRPLFPGIHHADDAQLAVGTLLAMSRWHFTPVTRHGAPAFAPVRIPVEFPSSADRAIDASHVDVPPRPVKMAEPEYPRQLRRRGLMGRVTLRFTVNKQGGVENLRAVLSSDPAFEAPAIAAVQQWRFEPAQLNGVPVNCQMEQPMVFSLQN